MTKLKNIKLLLLDVDGTMTDGGVYLLEDGSSFKKFNARDGMGVKLALKAGIKIGIISHSFSEGMITARAQTLGITYCYVGKKPKLQVLQLWLNELDISSEHVAFIGDDQNDREIMEFVGVSACPADAHTSILNMAKIKLSKNGGAGCIREFIDDYLID